MESNLIKLRPELVTLMQELVQDIKTECRYIVEARAYLYQKRESSKRLVSIRQRHVDFLVQLLAKTMLQAELSAAAERILWDSLVPHLRATHPFSAAA